MDPHDCVVCCVFADSFGETTTQIAETKIRAILINDWKSKRICIQLRN